MKFTYIDTKHSENFRVKICHNITLSELTVDFLPLDAHLFECVSWRERINFVCPQNEWSHAQQKSDRFFLFFLLKRSDLRDSGRYSPLPPTPNCTENVMLASWRKSVKIISLPISQKWQKKISLFFTRSLTMFFISVHIREQQSALLAFFVYFEHF